MTKIKDKKKKNKNDFFGSLSLSLSCVRVYKVARKFGIAKVS